MLDCEYKMNDVYAGHYRTRRERGLFYKIQAALKYHNH
jgi:hypothetical protein